MKNPALFLHEVTVRFEIKRLFCEVQAFSYIWSMISAINALKMTNQLQGLVDFKGGQQPKNLLASRI